jgi:hypothetical protein
VAGTFVDNLWERGHPARLRPRMVVLHQQKVCVPLPLPNKQKGGPFCGK